MLRQMSRRGRLEATLYDRTNSELKKLASILDPANDPALSATLSSSTIAEILIKAPPLLDMEYQALLQYLQHTGRPYRHWTDLPHPPNTNILPPQAEKPQQFSRNERTYSLIKSHKGNSAIYFTNPLTATYGTGFIESIWRLPLNGSLSTFIIICPHRSLSPEDEARAPFIQYPGLQTRILSAQPSDVLIIIEPTHIITHLTTFEGPSGTYGINQQTLIVSWALGRGRDF